MPEYIIANTLYPDAAHAAAAYDLAMDFDEAAVMFPEGMRGIVQWISYDHPELSKEDRNTLASAVHAHATRPDQDVPTSVSLRAWLRTPVHVEHLNPDQGLRTIPTHWPREEAPRGIRRLLGRLTR